MANSITWIGLARRIAHQKGFPHVTNAFLDHVMWEETGFPAFWQTSNPQIEFETQLRAAFDRIKARQDAKEGHEYRAPGHH